MRIVDIRERSVVLSRYADPAIPSGGLTTSIVALVTDVVRDGRPVVGYGFGSIGRFAQGGADPRAQRPGIGFEGRVGLHRLFRDLG